MLQPSPSDGGNDLPRLKDGVVPILSQFATDKLDHYAGFTIIPAIVNLAISPAVTHEDFRLGLWNLVLNR